MRVALVVALQPLHPLLLRPLLLQHRHPRPPP